MPERLLVSVLRFDTVSEELIRQAADAVRSELGRPPVERVGPHISLIPADTLSPSELLERLNAVVSARSTFEIRFAHLGWFPAGVLFLGATPSPGLLAFHQAIHQASSPSPHARWIDLYRPGAWVPHCTLSAGIPEKSEGAVLACALQHLDLPMRVTCRAVDVIEVNGENVRTVHTMPFGADGPCT